jgi:ribosomal RNA assembly protein
MLDFVRIPEERKGALIGKSGAAKAAIEKKTGVKITIGEVVEIEGEDAVKLMEAKQVVTAIGRGFAPSRALRLLNEDFHLIVISLSGENRNTIKRLMARIIGAKGRAKRIIEKYTETKLCVYGKTVSIIGEWEGVEKAKGAVELLLKGKPHAYVYKMLEERQ